MRQSRFLVLSAALFCGAICSADQWSTSTSGSLLQFNYGSGGNTPQYGVLDLTSSYFRMNYGPASGWGTSILTMPSYWSGGSLFQGTAVVASTQVVGANLVLTVDGTSNSLHTHETITIAPPSGNAITAQVAATTSGTVALDNRPGEAFKPVFLSSMHESPTSWDASSAYVGSTTYGFPSGGWIVSPSPVISGTVFGLLGGTSAWKTNAPAVQITLSSPMQVAGWVTTSSNPNDDNVGLWAASNTVLSSWNYGITVSNAVSLPVPEPGMLGFGAFLLLPFLPRRKG